MKKKVILCVAFVIITYFEIKKYVKIKKDKEWFDTVVKKDNIIMETLTQWVQIEHENASISGLLSEMKYTNIGIYGYGYLGKQLEKVLLNSSVNVACVIDKKLDVRENGGKILRPEDKLPVMDVIVVASSYYYMEIKAELEKLNVQADILSLDTLLYQL